MEFVGLSFSIISTTAALAFSVNQLIAELEAAGDKFDDIVYHFTLTRMALSRLKDLFKSNPLPLQMSEYTSQMQEHQRALDSIDLRLRKTDKGLASKSFRGRLAERRDLLGGDLQRFTDQISALNESLNLMATTYNSAVTGLIRDDIRRIRADVSSLVVGSCVKAVGSKTPVRSTKMDISLHYVEMIEMQQEHIHISQDLEGADTSIKPTMGIRSAVTTSIIGTMEWDFDPLGFLSAMRKNQNERARAGPVQIMSKNLDGLTHDPKHPKLAAITPTKRHQQTQTPGISLGTKAQQISLPDPGELKNGSFKPPTQKKKYYPPDYSDMHTIMDEEWGIWDKKHGVGVGAVP